MLYMFAVLMRIFEHSLVLGYPKSSSSRMRRIFSAQYRKMIQLFSFAIRNIPCPYISRWRHSNEKDFVVCNKQRRVAALFGWKATFFIFSKRTLSCFIFFFFGLFQGRPPNSPHTHTHALCSNKHMQTNWIVWNASQLNPWSNKHLDCYHIVSCLCFVLFSAHDHVKACELVVIWDDLATVFWDQKRPSRDRPFSAFCTCSRPHIDSIMNESFLEKGCALEKPFFHSIRGFFDSN